MSRAMQVNILSIFPNYFSSALEASMIKRAIKSGIATINLVDIRQYAKDKHKTTDDRPFGGAPGMVMKIEPIKLALQSLKLRKNAKNKIILLSARGKTFDQAKARELSALDSLTLICGHYGDVDQRVADYLADEELSIGSFVLAGGEPAALVVTDAVIRLQAGVLGNQASLDAETHDQPGFISPPQYTRPAEYKGYKVPDVLLSGDPNKIKNWQLGNKAELLD